MIVVDTSPFFHGPMLATLDRTDELLLLCGLDVPTMKNVRLSLQTLELLSFPHERIRVVLNRANTQGRHEAAARSRRRSSTKVRFELPSDRAVPLAVNRGTPVVLGRSGRGLLRRRSRAMAKARAVPSRKKRSASAAVAQLGEGVGDGSPRSPQAAQRTAAATLDDATLRPPRRAPSGAEPRPASRSVRRAEDAHPPRVHREARRRALQAATSTEDLAERVLRAVTEQLALDRTPLTREERRQLVREITDDILGYGPLEPFLRDDSVTEVMVNGRDRIYVERAGKIERTNASFADNAHLLRIIDKIVSQVGRRIDEASPMVDARLPGRQPCERDHPAARAQRADADDPEVLARPVHDGRPDRVRHAHRPRPRSSCRVRARAS